MTDIQAAPTTGGQAPSHRIPPVAEVFGYIGGALALAAVATLMSMFWVQLGVWGRVGICAALAVAGLLGGFAIERLEDAAAKRLSRFLLFVGVAATGVTIGFLVQYLVLERLSLTTGYGAARDKANEWAWFAGAAAAAVSGGAVWLRRRTWLQHLAFGLGVGLSALFVLPLLPVTGHAWGAGLVLAAVGVAWGAMTLAGWLPPDDAGLTLSALGILGGIQLSAMSGSGGALLGWAVWLGLGASIALLVAGALFKRLVVVGLAVVGVVIFAVQLVSEVLKLGMGTPLALLAVGLVSLAAAVWMMLRYAPAERPAGRIGAEVAGYAGAAFLTAGTGALLGEYWTQIGVAGRIAVPAIDAVVAYVSALVVERTRTDSARRLSQVLYAAGAVAVSGAVAMAAHRVAEVRLGPPPTGEQSTESWMFPESWASLAGALTAVALGGATWWFRKGAITQIVPGVGVAMAVTSGFSLLPQSAARGALAGAILLGIGIAWVLLSVFERVTPSNTGISVGCALSIFGVMQMMSGGADRPAAWPLWLGIALSVAAIVASIPLRRGVLLGFGAAGVVLFAFVYVQAFFQGRIAAPVVLLVSGVLFIAMAVLVAVALPKTRRDAPSGPAATG